jgi:phosphate transport system permease protein
MTVILESPVDPTVDPIIERRRAVQAAAASSLRRRKLGSVVSLGICWLFLAIAIVPLVAVVVYAMAKGLAAWNTDFFTKSTTPEGIPGGGVWNAIVGTVVITTVATAVAVPLGLFCGLFLTESDGRAAQTLRFTADVMTGIPSITVGIFGYIAIVRNFGYSGFAGAFAVGFIMLPVIIRSGETAFRGVPRSLSEAAMALGARRATIARRVVVPTALPGVITGVLLAIARGLGETAPLLLTIFGNQYLQWNPTKPMSALPTLIYSYSGQPFADLVQVAWGAALLLMTVVLALSIGSRLLAAYLQKERR